MKLKTKKAVKKRFVVTAKGKLLRTGGLSSHLKERKTSKRLRSQIEPKAVNKSDSRRIRRLLAK